MAIDSAVLLDLIEYIRTLRSVPDCGATKTVLIAADPPNTKDPYVSLG